MNIIKKIKSIDKTALVVGAACTVIAGGIVAGIYLKTNTTIETSYCTGVVTDKDHDHWVTLQPIYDGDGNFICYNEIHHDHWETNIHVVEYDNYFTDTTKSGYQRTNIGQEVKVEKRDYYYKNNYSGTYYHLILE